MLVTRLQAALMHMKFNQLYVLATGAPSLVQPLASKQ
jgi:hypothetical protein